MQYHSDEITCWSAIVEGCIDACRQCEEVASSLTPDLYRSPIGVHSSIGAHLRHTLDHFTCLLRGMQGGRINYDARDRDLRIEVDPAFCVACLHDIIHGLEAIKPTMVMRSVAVVQTANPSLAPIDMSSTLGRELMNASSHTIHHLALIRLLAERIGVILPAHVGVAYSTTAHRLSMGQQAGAGAGTDKR